MTLPMESAPPAYIIYRDTPQGEPFDPTAPPQFFPPKDSDELFDALRVKFPHVKTHSERMRDAVIEFLLEERQAEQLKSASPMFPTETAATSPWQSWPSMSSGAGSSTLSSPETLNLETPASTGSPQFQPPQMSRQYSTATSESTPPALDQMTSVFSLSAESQPKTRVRRKMTEEEKIEYRKRRIVKACEKCSKRKRKVSLANSRINHQSRAYRFTSAIITSPRWRPRQLALPKQPRSPNLGKSLSLTLTNPSNCTPEPARRSPVL